MSEDLNNEDMDIIVLNDENGKDMRFEYLDTIEYDGEAYVVLIPIDEDDEDAGSVVILKVEDMENDQQEFTGVEDTDILDAVFGIFKDKFKDAYQFGDEDEF